VLYQGPPIGEPSGVAVDRSGVYFTDFTDGSAHFMNGTVNFIPAGGGPPQVLVSGQQAPFNIVVTATGLYWANWGAGGGTGVPSVNLLPLGGGPPSPLVTVTAGSTGTDIRIAVVEGRVYWSDSANGTINRIADGENTVLASGQANPRGLATDGVNVYWATLNDGNLRKIPVEGGAIVDLATGLSQPFAVAVDDRDVYWTMEGNGAVGPHAAGAVCRVSVAGGAVEVLAEHQTDPYQLVLDADNVYWTDAIEGTIHKLHKSRPDPRESGCVAAGDGDGTTAHHRGDSPVEGVFR
jgi:sugar lactone lactonase YvrE